MSMVVVTQAPSSLGMSSSSSKEEDEEENIDGPPRTIPHEMMLRSSMLV
jgi:hypothetical protein